MQLEVALLLSTRRVRRIHDQGGTCHCWQVRADTMMGVVNSVHASTTHHRIDKGEVPMVHTTRAFRRNKLTWGNKGVAANGWTNKKHKYHSKNQQKQMTPRCDDDPRWTSCRAPQHSVYTNPLTKLINKIILRTANDMNSILVSKKLTFDRFWCRIADPQPPWELSADCRVFSNE